MLNQAWAHKELNTFCSWTELKHDTIYIPNRTMEMGGGLKNLMTGVCRTQPPFVCSFSCSVRYDPMVYSPEICWMKETGKLEPHGNPGAQVKTISGKELKEKPLTEEEYELIRSFGGQLEHFWLEALRDQAQEGGRSMLLTNNRAPLVADVATAPPNTVLEEATGYIDYIYAIVPVEGKLRIAKGGVFSYYEFPWPAEDRLTDEKWWEMLDNQQVPDRPA